MSVAPQVQSLPEALARLHHVYQVFGPLDNSILLDEVLTTERGEIEKATTKIVKEFALASTEKKMRAALLAAADAYWTWWVLQHDRVLGTGPKERAESLELPW